MDIESLSKELEDLDLDKLEELLCEFDDYEVYPVDIEEFITNPEYLGTYFAEGFRPYWMEVLKRVYPSTVYDPYYLVMLRGSIGRGKSTTACIGILYDTYRLLCRINPQKSMGLTPGTKLAMALFNMTMALAEDVVWETISGMISASPYFSRLISNKPKGKSSFFPKNIDFVIGSRVGHTIGRGIHSTIIDEANFEHLKDQVYQSFNSLLRRMQSRSVKKTEFGVAGKLWVVSSEKGKLSTLNNLMEKYINRPGVYVDGGDLYNSALWHVIPEKYSGPKFEVFIGSELISPQILELEDLDDDKDSRLKELYPDLVIQVPIEHKDDFTIDIHLALADLAGIGTTSNYKLFKLRERLNNAFVVSSVFPDTIYLDFDDDDDQVINYSKYTNYFKKRILFGNHPRAIHIDIGLTGDSLGIAGTVLTGFKSIESVNPRTLEKFVELVPTSATEWSFAVRPTPGKQVPLFKIRNFIYTLTKLGYPIFKITCDGFQSADFLQLLRKNNYDAELLSVDRTAEPYLQLRSAIYRGLHTLNVNEVLKKETNELEVNGEKIDHPVDGSKDIADAVCGSHYTIFMNADKLRMQFVNNSKLEETEGMSDELKEMFFGSV